MEKKPIFSSQFILFIIGSILILFASTYLFTRTNYWSCFNFNETGQIGDTIGGITSPIMNLIGSILVYISFKEQINANKLQYKLFEITTQNATLDRNFQIALELFKELKEDYRNLEHSNYKNQSAINLFVNEIDSSNWTKENFDKYFSKPIYSNWKFIINEYDLLLSHIIGSKIREEERFKLFGIAYNYYLTHLVYSIDIIVVELEKFETDLLFLELSKKFYDLHKQNLKKEMERRKNKK